MTIRIIGFGVIIPLIALLKKQNLQAKKDKEVSKLQEENIEIELKTSSVEITDVDQHKTNTVKEIKSEFIDTYNHPDQFTTTRGFFSIGILWIFFGIIIPLILYFGFNMSTTIVTTIAIIILFITIYSFRYSIKMNKDCVLINLYTDKITYSRKLGKFLFEIPVNEIKKLEVIVESTSSPLYPNQLIFIDVNNEYFQTKIIPVLKNQTDLKYPKLFKIKGISDGFYKLKGINNTQFNDEIFKIKYGKTLKE